MPSLDMFMYDLLASAPTSTGATRIEIVQDNAHLMVNPQETKTQIRPNIISTRRSCRWTICTLQGGSNDNDPSLTMKQPRRISSISKNVDKKHHQLIEDLNSSFLSVQSEENTSINEPWQTTEHSRSPPKLPSRKLSPCNQMKKESFRPRVVHGPVVSQSKMSRPSYKLRRDQIHPTSLKRS